MVRPEKLAALRERMEALGIREQDLRKALSAEAGEAARK